MGYLEIFEMNENGAGWTALDKLGFGDVVELGMSLSIGEIKNLCHICLAEIGKGNSCETHRNAKGSMYLP
jgi:hypothetical protein